MILYLISIVFGLIIFLCLMILFLFDDHRAKIHIKSFFFHWNTRSPSPYPWKERFYQFLNVIVIPDRIRQAVDGQKVIWSGIQMTHHQYVSLWWLLSLSGIFLGFLTIWFVLGDLVGILLIIAMVLLIAFGPNLYLQYRIRARKKEVERSLPEFLDMLTLNVEVGISFIPALKRIHSGITGVLKDEVGRALIQMELGFSRQEVLGGLAKRIPSSDVANSMEAILLSERLGTSLARTIKVQSNMLRSRRRQRAEVQARTAPIRIIPALVFFFLPGLLLVYLAPPIINLLFH